MSAVSKKPEKSTRPGNSIWALLMAFTFLGNNMFQAQKSILTARGEMASASHKAAANETRDAAMLMRNMARKAFGSENETQGTNS